MRHFAMRTSRNDNPINAILFKISVAFSALSETRARRREEKCIVPNYPRIKTVGLSLNIHPKLRVENQVLRLHAMQIKRLEPMPARSEMVRPGLVDVNHALLGAAGHVG